MTFTMPDLTMTNIVIGVVGLIALFVVIGLGRTIVVHAQNVLFGGTMLLGAYLAVATFFPDDVTLPSFMNDGFVIIGLFAVIIFLSTREAFGMVLKLSKFAVMFAALVSILNIIVYDFIFNGNIPTVQQLALDLRASVNSPVTVLVIVALLSFVAISYFRSRRANINVDKRVENTKRDVDERYDRRVDERYTNWSNNEFTMAQRVRAVITARTLAYDTPGGNKLGQVSANSVVTLTTRSDDNQWYQAMNSAGRTFWIPTQSVSVQAGDVRSLPIFEVQRSSPTR